ncbi:copper homeostasis protein CutC [Marinifilum caeruleilacunae]|uniref:PF03932 family protein CutC n=1 Tax=Marinifilum caeruleilacunae TaxID=2499076 RepID=A0ABX1WR78_9BACT|nr:copper homeostasis protein CutC [Marinifilum caeruleilacunae]NOU58584.1 copper homeostasis protein CutC [Marinifilum caeruleilacunae]
MLEICCYSVQSAIIAEQSGANRIELCAGVYEGGTTPSLATIQMAKEQLSIPVHVIIRPRGADFCYSDLEFENIKKDILACKELGVEGVVSGILLSNGSIDIARNKELVELAKPMSFTFHRAFDMVENHAQALDQLIEMGVDRILTSGGMQTAEEGIDLLKKLVDQAEGRIVIMPGSGVNENNIGKLKEITGAKEFHCSAKKLVKSKMEYQNPNINMGGEGSIPEFEYYEADSEKIKRTLMALKA